MWKILVSITLVSVAANASAQQGTAASEVESAAASYAVKRFVKGHTVLDTVPLEVAGNPAHAKRTAAETASLLRSLGLTQTANRREVVTCAAPRSTDCHLTGADGLLSFSRPFIAGDTAYVTVRMVTDGYQKRNLYRREERLMLVRQGGVWLVKKTVGRSVT
jgi:hypothetical protein